MHGQGAHKGKGKEKWEEEWEEAFIQFLFQAKEKEALVVFLVIRVGSKPG